MVQALRIQRRGSSIVNTAVLVSCPPEDDDSWRNMPHPKKLIRRASDKGNSRKLRCYQGVLGNSGGYEGTPGGRTRREDVSTTSTMMRAGSRSPAPSSVM